MYLYESDFAGVSGYIQGLSSDEPMASTPKVSQDKVARIKSAAALVAKKAMLQRQAAIAKKLGLPASTIGFVSRGGSMGHILSTWQATKEGEGPWYSPGSEHNEKHRTGFWPDMKQYEASILADVKRLNGMSQYEIEHMKKPMLDALVAKARAGKNVIAPSPAGPPPEPVEAANKALAQTAAGKTVLVAEDIYDAGAAAITAPFAIFDWVKRHKTKVIVGGAAVGLGLVALIVWPYIKAARAGGKALASKLGG
jgi:hypothetical protein